MKLAIILSFIAKGAEESVSIMRAARQLRYNRSECAFKSTDRVLSSKQCNIDRYELYVCSIVEHHDKHRWYWYS